MTVTTSEGGSVSEGGPFDEGTEVTITAISNSGYEFIGLEGSDSTEPTLTISLNSNITISATFQTIETPESYYSSGDIVAIDPPVFFDRSLTVYGIKLIAQMVSIPSKEVLRSIFQDYD